MRVTNPHKYFVIKMRKFVDGLEAVGIIRLIVDGRIEGRSDFGERRPGMRGETDAARVAAMKFGDNAGHDDAREKNSTDLARVRPAAVLLSLPRPPLRPAKVSRRPRR